MSGASTRNRSIFAPVTALAFNSRQLEDLQQFLARRSEQTLVVPISDVEQLLLGPSGRLAENGYRFNILGFQALANGLCAGLSSLFTELIGYHQKRNAQEFEPNIQAAVSAFNTVVRARIEIVRERTLLIDQQERVVEGFLGLNHRMLDNGSFLEIVQTEMRAKQPQAVFHRAELIGRELRVYYIDPATQRKDIYSDSRHSIAAGWAFSNSEDRQKAVTAGLCLFTRFGVAIERPKSNFRMSHVGADLEGRTTVLVSRAAAREPDMSVILSNLARLQTTPLGFVDETEKFDRTMALWVQQLVRLGVLRDDARAIVRNAAMVGADLTARDPVEVYTRSGLGARTAYDLMCSLLRYASNEPAKSKERLQMVAMDMVTPRQRKRKDSK